MNVIRRFIENFDREEIEKILNWNEHDEGKIFATLIEQFYATEKILETIIEEIAQHGHLDIRKHFEELKMRGREIAERKLSEKKTNPQILVMCFGKSLAITYALAKKLIEVLLLKSASSLKPSMSS